MAPAFASFASPHHKRVCSSAASPSTAATKVVSLPGTSLMAVDSAKISGNRFWSVEEGEAAKIAQDVDFDFDFPGVQTTIVPFGIDL